MSATPSRLSYSLKRNSCEGSTGNCSCRRLWQESTRCNESTGYRRFQFLWMHFEIVEPRKVIRVDIGAGSSYLVSIAPVIPKDRHPLLSILEVKPGLFA